MTTPTNTPSRELTVQQPSANQSIYRDQSSFEGAQRVALALAKSTMVPLEYQNNVPNVLVALEMANRIGASPLMVMQNLNIISGRPSWGSSFIIATIQSCGRFGPLRYKVTDLGDATVTITEWEGPKGDRRAKQVPVKIRNKSCVAYAIDKASGEVLQGPEVSVAMAVQEGWYTKAGSKWKTMPDLMLNYRAAAFFGRLYAPEIMMGMHTDDEVLDISPANNVSAAAEVLNQKTARPEPPVQEVQEYPVQEAIVEASSQPDIIPAEEPLL